jgi:hypothetical protein
MLKLMRSAKSETVKLNAAEMVLSRGRGKAIQAVQVDGRFLEKKLQEMMDTELACPEAKLLDDEGEPAPSPDLFAKPR